jgi:hypothetical protein
VVEDTKRSREELIREVEVRNQTRFAAGLPLLNVKEEVKKAYAAEARKAYVYWYNVRLEMIPIDFRVVY